MTSPTQTSTLSSIDVVMFAVSDQDAAKAFYCDVLGFEVRADTPYGPGGAMRWLEVAPPGSTTRLALVPPMGAAPGAGSIGVETTDVRGEHTRLSARGGVDLDPLMPAADGAPLMFMLRDPDGNTVVVVEPSGA